MKQTNTKPIEAEMRGSPTPKLVAPALKPAPKTRGMKLNRGFLLKAFISLGLLSVIYGTVSWGPLLSRLESVSLSGVLILIALYILGQLLSALKWKVFIECVGLERSTGSVIRAYFFGMFVNVFGFGTLGGDLARSLAIQPEKGKRAPALATVIADRIHGLCVLLAIGLISLSVLHPPGLMELSRLLLLGGGVGLLMLIVGWWQGPKLLQQMVPQDKKWGRVLYRVAEAFPRDRKRILKATVISFVFHNVQLLMHIVMAHELGAGLSNAEIYAAVPFVNIGSSIPISVMGVGVREGLYAVMFRPLQVPLEISVAFGALWILVTSVVSAFGALAITTDMKSLIFQQESLQEQSPNQDEQSLVRI